MTEPQKRKKPKLGELIVQAGIASPIDIDHALQAQHVFGGSLGTNLVEAGIIDDTVLAVFLSKQSGVNHVTEDELENVSPNTLALVPSKAAQQLSMIPLHQQDKALTIAMTDPTDQRLIDKVATNIGHEIIPKIAPEFTIHMALKKYYAIPLSPRISRLLHHRNQQQKDKLNPLTSHLDQHASSGDMLEYFFSTINDLEAIPFVRPIENIMNFNLTPELIFLFQQIDGISTISDMIQMSVFSKLETLRALVYFQQVGLITFDQKQADGHA